MKSEYVANQALAMRLGLKRDPNIGYDPYNSATAHVWSKPVKMELHVSIPKLGLVFDPCEDDSFDFTAPLGAGPATQE